MRAKYHGYFKVESIRTQYSNYSSFKVVAPMNLKIMLLNKNNWVENIYVRCMFHCIQNHVVISIVLCIYDCVYTYYHLILEFSHLTPIVLKLYNNSFVHKTI